MGGDCAVLEACDPMDSTCDATAPCAPVPRTGHSYCIAPDVTLCCESDLSLVCPGVAGDVRRKDPSPPHHSIGVPFLREVLGT